MKYALHFRSEGNIVECATMDEVWIYVRSNGLCSEVISNEHIPPHRIPNPSYEIHTLATDGELFAMTRINLVGTRENN